MPDEAQQVYCATHLKHGRAAGYGFWWQDSQLVAMGGEGKAGSSKYLE